MIYVVTQQRWRAEELAKQDRFEIQHDWGFGSPAFRANTTGIWAPGEWVDKLRFDQPLPLASPTMRDLPLVAYTGCRCCHRSIEIMSAREAVEYLGVTGRRMWVKHPLVKRGDFPAQLMSADRLDEAIAHSEVASIHADTLVQVAPPLNGRILAEWRVFVNAFGQAVTGCRYALDGEIGEDVWSTEVPKAVENGARSKWTQLMRGRPAYPLAVDMVELGRDGGYQQAVLEFNAPWSSDWYGSDVEAFLECVEQCFRPEPEYERYWWKNVTQSQKDNNAKTGI